MKKPTTTTPGEAQTRCKKFNLLNSASLLTSIRIKVLHKEYVNSK